MIVLADRLLQLGENGTPEKISKGHICENDKCKTPLLSSAVRRRRFGHIKLAAPVLNVAFLSTAAELLGLEREDLVAIIKGYPPRAILRDLDKNVPREKARLFCEFLARAGKNGIVPGQPNNGIPAKGTSIADQVAGLRQFVGKAFKEIQEPGVIFAQKLLQFALRDITNFQQDIGELSKACQATLENRKWGWHALPIF